MRTRRYDWLDRWQIRQAARSYARRLPPYLAKGWGKKDTYTAAQIQVALRQARLRGPFEYLAYAMFLEEADYALCRDLVPQRLPWRVAHALVEREVIHTHDSPYAFSPPPYRGGLGLS